MEAEANLGPKPMEEDATAVNTRRSPRNHKTNEVKKEAKANLEEEYDDEDLDEMLVKAIQSTAKKSSKRGSKKSANDEYDEDSDDDESDNGKKNKKTSSARKTTKTTTRKKTTKAERGGDGGDDDDSITPKKKRATKPKTPKTDDKNGKGKGKAKSKKEEEPEVPKPEYDPVAVKQLASAYPDSYWNTILADNIKSINMKRPLTLKPTKMVHPGNVYGMAISPDGSLLATASTLGSIRIWDLTTFEMLQEIRDEKEENIEEFFNVKFTPDSKYVVAAGKMKNRHLWDYNDNDNHIMPCPIKIFDVIKGTVVSKLEGHEEEVLCVKNVTFKGNFYYVSASYDGYVRKWAMENDHITLKSSVTMQEHVKEEEKTNSALSLSFLPNCGNKYFLAACDRTVKLYDFEAEQLLQIFPDMYSYYCDCVKFICTPYFSKISRTPCAEGEYFFITRGVETLNDDGTQFHKNLCHLRKITFPKSKNDVFKVELMQHYEHDDYNSNSWLIKFASNSEYIAAPTTDGRVFIWNMGSSKVTAILDDHEEQEVREVIFHPTRRLLFTCGDDSNIKVYEQTDEQVRKREEEEREAEEEAKKRIDAAGATTTTTTTATSAAAAAATEHNNTGSDDGEDEEGEGDEEEEDEEEEGASEEEDDSDFGPCPFDEEDE